MLVGRLADGGKADGEGTALIGGAFDFDIATVKLDHTADNRQADARALLFHLFTVDLREALKQPGEFIGLNADAVVTHAEYGHIAFAVRLNRHPAIRLAELD